MNEVLGGWLLSATGTTSCEGVLAEGTGVAAPRSEFDAAALFFMTVLKCDLQARRVRDFVRVVEREHVTSREREIPPSRASTFTSRQRRCRCCGPTNGNSSLGPGPGADASLTAECKSCERACRRRAPTSPPRRSSGRGSVP
jgi:hypothetical protein